MTDFRDIPYFYPEKKNQGHLRKNIVCTRK